MKSKKLITAKRLYFLLVIIGIMGIIDTLALAVFTNINLGTILPSILGIFLIGYVYIKSKLYHNRPIIKNALLRKSVLTVFTIFAISFLLVEGVILFNSRLQEDAKVDYLIILGGGINGDKITLALRERLDKGIEYMRSHPDIKVIVSGGQGAEETITEAEAMKRYLLEQGITAEQIIKEEKSTSTMENFRFSKELLSNLDNGDANKIMIITNDFHMFRSKLLARRNGFEAYGISSRTPLQVLLNCYIREFFALTKSFLIDH